MRAALILAAGRAGEACEPKGKAGRNSHHQGGKANHKGHEGVTKDTKEASPPNFSKTGYTGARTHKGAPCLRVRMPSKLFGSTRLKKRSPPARTTLNPYICWLASAASKSCSRLD